MLDVKACAKCNCKQHNLSLEYHSEPYMSTFEVEIEKNNKNDKTFAKNVKVIYKKRAFQSISKILGGSGSFFAFIQQFDTDGSARRSKAHLAVR